jgi:hypothetical protein
MDGLLSGSGGGLGCLMPNNASGVTSVRNLRGSHGSHNLYKKYENSTVNNKLRSKEMKNCLIWGCSKNALLWKIESEEFLKNQNCYIRLRRNEGMDSRYAEVGASLGLTYQQAYD